MAKNSIKMSKITKLHYVKLIFRLILFVLTLSAELLCTTKKYELSINDLRYKYTVMFAVWLVFLIEMVLRFFPSKSESMGCQKQFAKNAHIITGVTIPRQKSHIFIGIFWLCLTAAIGIMYYTHIIDALTLLVTSLFFSVCDMICILFFCPFQRWFMKNRCCVTCRIYNWDYAMMFSPLIFTGNIFALSLVVVAVALLVQWEIAAHLHPERFSATSNQALKCSVCTEQLCRHKRHLKIADNQ